MTKIILKKVRFKGPTLPDFKTYCKYKVNETVWYGHKYRQTHGIEWRI